MLSKQDFYALPNKDGYLTDISVENHSNDNDWISVTVPLDKLYGFGKWFYTVRYDSEKRALLFPDNWKPNQSKQIEDLQKEIQFYNQAIHKSNQNAQRLTQMVSFLQMQLAQNQKGGNK